jgi:GAF domain-containing protein
MIQPQNTPTYAHTRWRENFLRITLLIACALGLAILIPAILSSAAVYALLYAAIYILLLAVTFLPASYNLKAGTFVFLLYALAVSGLTETGIYGDARSFMLAAIAMSALFFSWRAGWGMTALAAITYVLFGWLILNGSLSLISRSVTTGSIFTWITGVGTTLLIALLLVNGIRLMQMEFQKEEDDSRRLLAELRQEQENLELRVQERTRSLDRRSAQFKAVADVGKSITSFRDLSELLQQAAQLIHENFGYYHVGIFLLDDRREHAVLEAVNRTSQGGLRMMEKKHRLKIGGTSIVGYVIENAQARIALDVGQDAVYFDNPDLPNTRSEMALPLVVGGRVLGALDVQSAEPRAFTEEDIATLQILAEQIAVAIQNANLFREAGSALEAARVSYGELSRKGWEKILHNQPRISILASPTGAVELESDTLEPSIEKAITTGDLIFESGGLTIGIPIKIRGQTIGAIRLKKPEIAEAWTQDEINLAIALSEQLSGALESARLYRESQIRAARESLVSDISGKISAVAQTDSIIRATITELGQAFSGASVTFQLLDPRDGQKQAPGPNGSRGAHADGKVGE